jgi:hypothetical protein
LMRGRTTTLEHPLTGAVDASVVLSSQRRNVKNVVAKWATSAAWTPNRHIQLKET